MKRRPWPPPRAARPRCCSSPRAGPIMRRSRDRAGVDAAAVEKSGRGRSADPQFPADWPRTAAVSTRFPSCFPRRPFPSRAVATIWPMSRRKSPRIGKDRCNWSALVEREGWPTVEALHAAHSDGPPSRRTTGIGPVDSCRKRGQAPRRDGGARSSGPRRSEPVPFFDRPPRVRRSSRRRFADPRCGNALSAVRRSGRRNRFHGHGTRAARQFETPIGRSSPPQRCTC